VLCCAVQVEEYLGAGAVTPAEAATMPGALSSSQGGSAGQAASHAAAGADAGSAITAAQQQAGAEEAAASGMTEAVGDDEAGDWVYDVYLPADGAPGPGHPSATPAGPDAPINLATQKHGAASGGGHSETTAGGEGTGAAGEAMELSGGEGQDDLWAEVPVVEVGGELWCALLC
jgi:hypothetical protein